MLCPVFTSPHHPRLKALIALIGPPDGFFLKGLKKKWLAAVFFFFTSVQGRSSIGRGQNDPTEDVTAKSVLKDSL